MLAQAFSVHDLLVGRSQWPSPRVHFEVTLTRLIFIDFYRFEPFFFQTFLGDVNPQKLPSRGLQTLWEWKNRVLLEEYYIFHEAIPLEVE